MWFFKIVPVAIMGNKGCGWNLLAFTIISS